MTSPTERMIPVDGEGLLARWPAGVVVLGGSTSMVQSALDVLSPRSDDIAASEPSSDELLDRLRALELDNFVAAVNVPNGRRIVCKGGGGSESLDSGEFIRSNSDGGLVEHDLSDDALWLGFGPAPFELETLREGPFRLNGGVLGGRGVIIERVEVRPAQIAESVPATEFEIVDLTPDVPREPLPSLTTEPPQASKTVNEPSAVQAESHPEESTDSVMVKGIVCSRGHFNNPYARYCSHCGISLVHETHRLVDGVRPSLGFIVFDDGSTFTLDRSYSIGRDPEPEPNSGLSPLPINDTENSVSRFHAELELDGWDVVLRDVGSTNGTAIWDQDQLRWNPVVPNRDQVIHTGSRISVGNRTFVYEAIDRIGDG